MNANASEWRPTFMRGAEANGEEGDTAAATLNSWMLSPATEPVSEATATDPRSGSAVSGALSPEMKVKVSSAEYYPTWGGGEAVVSPSSNVADRSGVELETWMLPPHAGGWGGTSSNRSGTPPPSFQSVFPSPNAAAEAGAAVGAVAWDWPAEFDKVLKLTQKVLHQQEEEERGEGAAPKKDDPPSLKSGKRKELLNPPRSTSAGTTPEASRSPAKPQAAASAKKSSKKVEGKVEPSTAKPTSGSTWADVLSLTNSQAERTNNTNRNAKGGKTVLVTTTTITTTTAGGSASHAKKSANTTNKAAGGGGSTAKGMTPMPATSSSRPPPCPPADPPAHDLKQEMEWVYSDDDGDGDDDSELHFGVDDWHGDDLHTSGGKHLPPLTVNGNRRWKKLSKGQRQRDLAQKTAFESFAKALLHATSPFTTPLRQRTKMSLPHIKVDQRFGKPGQPQSAISQFVVAPLTNYRPRHFHDITPGDLMEYHHDLCHVLQVIPSAYALLIGYGPTWKRFAVPYAYVACQNYRQEVLSLCPQEMPNSRSEPMYEEDLLKDITDLALAVEELAELERHSLLEAMRRRVNLAPLYDVLDNVFRPLTNYQVEFWHMDQVPSTFVIKVNSAEVAALEPIVLHGDPLLWSQMPVVTREQLKAKCTVLQRAAGGKEGPKSGLQNPHSTAAATSSAGSSLSVLPPQLQSTPPPSSGRGAAVATASAAALSAPVRKLHAPGKSAADTEAAGRHPESKDTMSTLLVAIPIAVSVICIATTVGVVLSRRGK